MTIAQIRKLDPNFIKEEWAEEVRSTLVPQLLQAHLTGNLTVIVCIHLYYTIVYIYLFSTTSQ